jgi:16S rRNA processing protein RimM
VEEPTVVVGLITRAHGLRGEVVVHSRSDNPDRWAPGSVVFLDERSLRVESIRPTRGGRMIVRFAGVDDRTQAESLRGEVAVPESWLPPLPDGEWWPSQIEGCEVITESGRLLGRVGEVVANPANDLWVAKDEHGAETIVPALNDLLVTVDTTAKRIVVRDVPGLTAPDADDAVAEPG